MSSIRIEKVSELLMNFVSSELLGFKDPRLELVTVTDVSITPDLKRAHVYWSKVSCGEDGLSFPSDEEVESISGALDNLKGRVRSKAAKALKLRHTPQFIFHYDKSGKTASRIEELLKEI